MRIHEIEIYSSKQIYAFIEYLKVLAEEKKAIEDMQASYAGGMIGANSCLNQGSALYATQATPEYLAKVRAEAVAQAIAEKTEVYSTDA